MAAIDYGKDGTRLDVLRCINTGNPCGTDTWKDQFNCGCENCQKWLSRTVYSSSTKDSKP